MSNARIVSLIGGPFDGKVTKVYKGNTWSLSNYNEARQETITAVYKEYTANPAVFVFSRINKFKP